MTDHKSGFYAKTILAGKAFPAFKQNALQMIRYRRAQFQLTFWASPPGLFWEFHNCGLFPEVEFVTYLEMLNRQ